MKALKCRILLVIALSMLSMVAFAQDLTVTGTVTDSTGEQLVGANVVVLNSKTPQGVMTDLDGNFSITVQKNSLLEVSLIGFGTQKKSCFVSNWEILQPIAQAWHILTM